MRFKTFKTEQIPQKGNSHSKFQSKILYLVAQSRRCKAPPFCDYVTDVAHQRTLPHTERRNFDLKRLKPSKCLKTVIRIHNFSPKFFNCGTKLTL